ncbi:response regulator [Noviherbaspirillum sp. ST9]|uniref:response regulator n=1 Tax=Noviherbaspirillum sp. ST9 TaxID=3401606 RepID=UPI003B58A5AA
MTRGTLQHILYVEDDADIRTIAQLALEAVGGYTLKVCASGQEALETVAAGYRPELILLDVMMPGLDGPGTLSGLRRLPSTMETPAVFMTAKVQASEIAFYKSLGAIGVLAKPFDPMALAAQVRRLWENGE